MMNIEYNKFCLIYSRMPWNLLTRAASQLKPENLFKVTMNILKSRLLTQEPASNQKTKKSYSKCSVTSKIPSKWTSMELDSALIFQKRLLNNLEGKSIWHQFGEKDQLLNLKSNLNNKLIMKYRTRMNNILLMLINFSIIGNPKNNIILLNTSMIHLLRNNFNL